jgi:glycosyltransferase involved in cell wall biosynthesis
VSALRLLYAVHAYKPAYRVGGPVVSVSSLAERLVARGHAVTVVTSNSNLDEDLDVPIAQPVPVDGVEVWYFRREELLKRWLPFVPYLSKSMGFLYSGPMRATLGRLAPSVDAVHTHLPFIYPTLAAARAAFANQKPLFYHQRGVFDPKRLRFRGLKKRIYIKLIERPVMRRATTLIALTEAERASYRALGVATACRVIPNGIDTRLYPSARRPEAGVRWRIPPEAQVVLFLGRVHPVKGADKLLEAFTRIAAAHPRAVLVLAGPDEWQLERRFRHSAARAGVSDRVVFTGMVLGEAKRDLLARADLFALPSDGEGFSMAVLEALASSIAVVLSPGCHFPEVEEVGAGRVAPTDPGRLADVLADLLADPERLREMGSRGRQLVGRRYTWDAVADAMIDAYREGIARHAATHVGPR